MTLPNPADAPQSQPPEKNQLEGQQAPGSEQQPQPKQPPVKPADKPVTMGELATILEGRDRQVLKRAGEGATARAKNAIDEYRRSLAVNKEAGIEITPEQQRAAEQSILNRSLIGDETAAPEAGGQAPSGAAAAPRPAPAAPQNDDTWAQYVYDQTQAVFLGAGATVIEGDAEYATILEALQNPANNIESYLGTVKQQADLKAARLKTEAEAAKVRGAGVTSGASAHPNPIANINDSAKLYEMGDAEIRAGRK